MKLKLPTIHCEKKIEMNLTYLDFHLQLLNEAITNGEQKNIDFQKSQIEKIRQELVSLEYFDSSNTLYEMDCQGSDSKTLERGWIQ